MEEEIADQLKAQKHLKKMNVKYA
eukprot:SAG22_NODE_22641_length_193_cov_16.276596_1_plen_23_part_01